MADKIDAPTSSEPSSIPRDGIGGVKSTIKNVDMSEDMQQESVEIANTALEKFNVEKDIAAHIKKEFDRRHGPTWHVVVGKNFGSYVTHGESEYRCKQGMYSLSQKPNISSTSTSAPLQSSSGNHKSM